MLGTSELLAAVRPLATNVEIARILDIPAPRVSELFRGARRLQLEEAKKLVEHFKLDEGSTLIPSLPLAELAVSHITDAVGVDLPDVQRRALARDLVALFASTSNEGVGRDLDAIRKALVGIRIRRKAENLI